MVIQVKKYTWMIPLFGVIISGLSLFFPAAYFENVAFNHQNVKWMFGFFQDTLNSNSVIEFYSYPLQLNASIITSTINVACLSIIVFIIIRSRTQLIDGVINIFYFIIPPILIILNTLTWMIMMEISEQEIYGLSLWNRYVPRFGLVGSFLGGFVVIFGAILIKYVPRHI